MNLIPSFRDSIFEPMSGSMIDIGEVALDSVLEDGVLKEIPIIGTIAGITKATVAINERRLAKNTYAFIYGIREGNVPADKVEAYKAKLNDPKKAEKELGYVLLLLDREIYAEKSQILGRMYAAVVDGRLTWNQFQELSEALDRMFVADFAVLGRMRNGSPLAAGVKDSELHGLQRLHGLGLVVENVRLDVKGTRLVDVGFGSSMVISSLGLTMMEFV